MVHGFHQFMRNERATKASETAITKNIMRNKRIMEEYEMKGKYMCLRERKAGEVRRGRGEGGERHECRGRNYTKQQQLVQQKKREKKIRKIQAVCKSPCKVKRSRTHTHNRHRKSVFFSMVFNYDQLFLVNLITEIVMHTSCNRAQHLQWVCV